MTYLNTYKSFINSQYFSEGLRITVAVIFPAFVLGYFNNLAVGIIISLGALLVSINDAPGPAHHRRNGMFVCTLSIFIVSLITGLIATYPAALACFLIAACFFFSMISVYGARAAGIGTASMIIITLTIDSASNQTVGASSVLHSFYILAGALWYLILSIVLQNFRPYRLAQQALGDLIQETAGYLHLRSELFKPEINYETAFKKILQQQTVVQQKQNELNELLFKTRSIIKESTITGRTLVMIHLDITDMFERISMSYQKYELLHTVFDNTNILKDYYVLLQKLVEELNAVGVAVKSREESPVNESISKDIKILQENLEKLRHNSLTADNIEGFIGLRKTLNNIEDLAARLKILQEYTAYGEKLSRKKIKGTAFNKLITSQKITTATFVNNLTLKSETFRHAIRVSTAVITGFLLAHYFKIGHSYWILLTIIVILKPAYSLTKKRNGERLAGTVCGIFIGLFVLQLTHNSAALLALLIILMAGSYMAMRKNYFLSVLMMTPYLVLFYYILSPANFNALLKDRVLDTAIGCIIAFVASLLIFPTWEKDKIKTIMTTALNEGSNYFLLIADSLKDREITFAERQVARKNAMVALANLSDAFNRMLSEPTYRQKGIEKLHQFVVLNHMFISYISTLADTVSTAKEHLKAEQLLPVTEEIQKLLGASASTLNNESTTRDSLNDKETIRKLNEMAEEVLEKRKEELSAGLINTPTVRLVFNIKSVIDQFNLVYNAAYDLNKVTTAIAPLL